MSGAHVVIDPSQFPENVRHELLESLRARAINHKFHYDSYKQTAQWLALHEAYSPARRDGSCQDGYDEAFSSTVAMTKRSEDVHVIGLGCGGGQKEARLLQLLSAVQRKIIYTPTDVSLPLVLMSRQAALPFVPQHQCRGIVCDLGTTKDLAALIDECAAAAARIITLFGIMPNFEPTPLLSQITRLLRTGDLFLISANLAPGNNYAAGVCAVLPQYDNELTRDWLLTLLLDLGFERDDGELSFAIETDARELLRITAHFHLIKSREIRVFNERLFFRAGERMRLFFSYRHTSQTIHALACESGLHVHGQWLNDEETEGVFLCRKIG